MSLKNIRLLVDMDNVIANWDLGMLEGLRKKHPNYPFIKIKDRTIRNIYDQYQKKFGAKVVKKLLEIHKQKGFYRNLKPIEGMREALENLSHYFNVVICGEIPHNAPKKFQEMIIQEKLDWIDEHLGKNWSKNAIFIPYNKVAIKGHYLIDDTPNKGNGEETWEQILFKWPYNNNVMKDSLRIDWSEWELVVQKIINDLNKNVKRS